MRLTAGEIRLQETFRESLDPGFGMDRNPASEHRVVLEAAVIARQVVQFRNPAQGNLAVSFPHDREAYRVGLALLREARATARVSEIAALHELVIAGNGAVVSRSAAEAAITSAEWKPRGMRESGIIEALGRDEVGAGQAFDTIARKKTPRAAFTKNVVIF